MGVEIGINMELDLISMGSYLEPMVRSVREHHIAWIFLTISVSTVFIFLLVQRLGRDLFRLYRRNFLTQVDQGLRDIVVMMEPGQILTITVAIAAVMGPIILFISNMAVACAVIGVVLLTPPIGLRVLKKRRSKKFVDQMPDMLHSMSSSLRSGLNLIKTLQQIVKNQPNPVAREFSQVLIEYRVGNDLNDSLDTLAERLDRPEIVLMNSAIKISRAVGGNLADTLEILSKTLREKSRVEGRIRALTSMGKAQGRLATVFPVFMGVLFYKFEPQSMMLLFTSTLGHIWIAVMVGLALTGSWFIKKVVNIDV